MRKRERWSLSRKLSVAVAFAALSMVANAGSLWWSSNARAENCDRTRAALDVFTDSLGVATGAPPEVVEAFRADWHTELDGCS